MSTLQINAIKNNVLHLSKSCEFEILYNNF